MSGIIPRKGQYFSVKSTLSNDRSYQNDVFKCEAEDGMHIAATSPTVSTTLYKENQKFLFNIFHWDFHPVSCDVVKALDIKNCESGFFKRCCCG